jgi:hypothetical protein
LDPQTIHSNVQKHFALHCKNTLDMIRPATKRMPWGHILCWAIYLLLFNVLPDYGGFAGFGKREWLLYAYNIAAGVAIFYTAAHFAAGYIERHYIDFVLEDSFRKKILLLLKWPVFAIGLLVGAYVTITLLLKSRMYGPGQWDMVLQVETCISRAFRYVVVAVFYALVRWPGPQGGDGGGPPGDGGPPIVRYKVVKPVRAKGEKVG